MKITLHRFVCLKRYSSGSDYLLNPLHRAPSEFEEERCEHALRRKVERHRILVDAVFEGVARQVAVHERVLHIFVLQQKNVLFSVHEYLCATPSQITPCELSRSPVF